MSAAAFNATPWRAWWPAAKRAHLATFKGWPPVEYKGYWERGMTPEQAFETAAKKRQRNTGSK